MSVFVYAQGIKIVHAGEGVKNGKLLSTQLLNAPQITRCKQKSNIYYLFLIKSLCESYGLDDRITSLVNSTRIHIMPSMNPDGFENSHEKDRSSIMGRANDNNIDLNR